MTRTCGDCPTPLARPYARWCDNCRWKHRGKPALYEWTPERDQVLRDRYDSRVKGRAKEIARGLGFPAWVVKRRAGHLGLSRPKEEFLGGRGWTADEERFLFEHAGTRHARWMARKLGRTEASVVLKLKRLELSRRIREGYTMRELELCFGADHKMITRWIERGWLEAERRDEGGERPAFQIRDAAILRFVQEHPLAFELRRVDPVWFMDLMTSGGLIRKALGIEAAIDAGEEQAA